MPEDIRTAVRNNGGGHVNHTMFWQIMGPKARRRADRRDRPTRSTSAFGGFDKFKEADERRPASSRFGSGWAWLIDSGGKLAIESTPNQDSPLMEGKKADPRHRRLGARLLPQVSRTAGPDYLDAWWNVVNWAEVNKRLRAGNVRQAS
mgnify:CR=1 FL=1